MIDAAYEWLAVAAVVDGGVGHGHRQVRAPVEGALEGDDARPPRRLLGELHGVLDRLGAGVHVHDLVDRVGQKAGERRAQIEHGLVAIDAGLGMRADRRLILHRPYDPRVTVTCADDGDADDEIEPLAAVGAVDPAPLGVIDRDRRERVQEVRQVPVDRRLVRHARDLQRRPVSVYGHLVMQRRNSSKDAEVGPPICCVASAVRRVHGDHLSLGERSDEDLVAWREAGAPRGQRRDAEPHAHEEPARYEIYPEKAAVHETAEVIDSQLGDLLAALKRSAGHGAGARSR